MSLYKGRKQAALEHALRFGDLKKFQLALKDGGSVDVLVRGSHYTIFETACNTQERHEFISACFNDNVPTQDPRFRENPVTHEYPIHLAALSMDKNNLTALLEGCPELSTVVEQQYKDRTALFLLFERLNSSNFAKGTECIKVLLDNGANINTHNGNQVTAIEMLLRGKEEWRKMVLQQFLQTGKVILNAALRQTIQRTFPELPLPEGDGRRLQALMLLLEAKSDQKFIANYEQEANDEPFKVTETKTLLTAAITHGKEQAVRKMLTNERNTEEREMLLAHGLDVCVKYGADRILECLLGEIPENDVKVINTYPLLSLLTKQINGNSDKRQCGFFKCMQTLLEDPRIEVNKPDSQQLTALHYAVKFRLEHVQELLLTNGAYLGGEDLFGRPLICDLNPYLLMQQLNQCVTDNGIPADDKDYKIKLNFRNFQSPTHTDEMVPIVRLAQSSEGRKLLDHPVIASILLIKWLRISLFFYLNLFLCAMFFFSFMAFMVLCYAKENYYQAIWLFLIPTVVGLAYITIRELAQFVLNTSDYFKSAENCIELMLIVSSTTAIVLHFTTGGDQIRKFAEVCAILLSAVEFTVLLATIPRLSYSTHMVMLKTVAKNFIHCLSLYSMILVGFGISFYTLFREPNGNGGANRNNNATDPEESNPFNEFGMLSMALLKTTVMMTGEFEAAELRLHQSWGLYVLFVLFLFFVPVVLYNLMNGLAVNDAATCQKNTELIALKQKVFVINSCEGTLKALNGMRKKLNKYLGELPVEMMENFEYIWIRPNNGNTIEVPAKEVSTDQSKNPNGHEGHLEEVTVVIGKTEDAIELASTDEANSAAKPTVAVEALEATSNVLLKHLADSDLEPTLSELPGRMDDTIVTAAKGILYSNREESTNQDLKMQQTMYHLSQEFATMNNLLMARHQQELPQLGAGYPCYQTGK